MPKLLKLESPRSQALQQKEPQKWEAYTPKLESFPGSQQGEKSLHSSEDSAETIKNLIKFKRNPVNISLGKDGISLPG